MSKRNRENGLWARIWSLAKFYYLKIMRNSGSPEYIGRGAAVGIFVSFFLPVGFQTIPAIVLAFLVRGAKIPAVVLTFISNYATIVVIYPVQCYIGSFLLFDPISYRELVVRMKELFQEMSFEAFTQLGGELIAAFFAGGLLLGVGFALPGYFLTVKLVREFRRRREERRQKWEAMKL